AQRLVFGERTGERAQLLDDNVQSPRQAMGEAMRLPAGSPLVRDSPRLRRSGQAAHPTMILGLDTDVICIYIYLHMTQREKCAEISELCTVSNLRRASRVMTRMYDQDIAPSGLRATQFTMLVAVCLASPARISRLAEVLGMDRSTLSRN